MGRDCASERVPHELGGQPDQALAALVRTTANGEQGCFPQ